MQQPATRPGVGSPQAGSDVRFAAALVAVLVVLGAALGPLWAWWSPPGPAALIYPGGALQPDETEAWVAGDGRFVIICAAVGLIAAVACWLRRGNRGAVVAAALAVGGVGGALVMDLVGYLAGGGDGTGTPRRLADGTVRNYTAELPLWVHSSGMLVVEAAVAVLVYGVLVAFARHDDLGLPDPVRDGLRAPQQDLPPGALPVPPLPVEPRRPTPYGSVDPDRDAQDRRADGDAAGPFQQG